MKMKALLIVLALLMGTTLAQADEAQKNAQAEKLLSLLRVDQQLAVTNQRMRMQTERLLASQNLPEELATKMQKVFDKQFDLVSDVTNWDDMKNEVIAVYTTTFTEDEINGLVDFYASDLGQKMLDKLPLLFQKGMEIAQNRLIAKQQEIEETMRAEWVKFEDGLTEEERSILDSIRQPGDGIQN